MPGISPITLGRDQHPDPAFGQQLRRHVRNEPSELLGQRGDRPRELADAADQFSGDPHPHGRLCVLTSRLAPPLTAALLGCALPTALSLPHRTRALSELTPRSGATAAARFAHSDGLAPFPALESLIAAQGRDSSRPEGMRVAG